MYMNDTGMGKESFRVKTKFVNFVVGRFLYVIVAVYTYFEGLSGYRNTHRVYVCI